MIRRGNGVTALIFAALAAACSPGAGKQAVNSTPPPVTSQAEVDKILSLLDNGEEKKAAKRLSTALKRDSRNPSLQVLRDSIELTPEHLLGSTSFLYTTQHGDTMSLLAERFLGNKLKAYQLAKYNGIERPASLAVGHIMKIPRQVALVTPTPVSAPRAVSKMPPPRPRAAAPRPKAVTKSPAPSGNSTAARESRMAGLAALNRGRPAQAVALLSRAATLDPANHIIARDLARARRIAATVRAQN